MYPSHQNTLYYFRILIMWVLSTHLINTPLCLQLLSYLKAHGSSDYRITQLDVPFTVRHTSVQGKVKSLFVVNKELHHLSPFHPATLSTVARQQRKSEMKHYYDSYTILNRTQTNWPLSRSGRVSVNFWELLTDSACVHVFSFPSL